LKQFLLTVWIPKYNFIMKKNRLDIRMVDLGLVESRTLGQRLVMAGQVRVNGNLAMKASDPVGEEDVITVDQGPRYVSRGGEKLEAALEAFFLSDLNGMICADLGSSTGGFTDCLLQHSAVKVYAVDVGQGILHWKLRNDPRVVVMEETNARSLVNLPEKMDLITVDVSFISATVILPVIQKLLRPVSGKAVILVKPQFEAGREEAARGKGVIRDPKIHRQVLQKVLQAAQEAGFWVRGLIVSPLLGPKGNREFLMLVGLEGDGTPDFKKMIETSLQPTAEKTEN
jgi:23S rRNA (cytidine1920-2'-O)/16S rRNA (cytidine1409-2'-O)-methyltransferase